MTHIEQKKKRYPYDWRKYWASHPWAKHRMYAKSRSIHTGIEITLTTADFKALWERNKADLLKRPSIDRIDRFKGYVEGNCRFIERSENCGRDNLGRKATASQKAAGSRNLSKWARNQTKV